MSKTPPDFVYRLASMDEWLKTQATGVAPKREIDLKDGYVHLSTREQVLETARLHFAGADDLLALEIPVEAVAEDLKFELAPKRGEEFPHLYRDLLAGDVAAALRLERDGEFFSFGSSL
ncbi:DUF952 domain-containing protein [Hyphococcus sp.]|jgi:uncharacterized protein (DUF952 family)|uniref:DUF952 domain-containing protein n=1 Tax=Hyphococcus sp. TaxID=2038636 RepID=UPI003D1438CB